MLVESLFLPILFLLASTFFSMLAKSMEALGKTESKKELSYKTPPFFVYALIRKLFHKESYSSLVFISSHTRHIIRILYATTFLLYFLSHPFFSKTFSIESERLILEPSLFALIMVIIILLDLFMDFVGSLLGSWYPRSVFRLSYPIASLFLLSFSPLTLLIYQLQRLIFSIEPEQGADYPSKIKDKIIELVHESELHHQLSLQDKKLMISVASFKDRIAREIMVPRIDIFMLSSESSVEEAVQAFTKEGYSRVPVYKNTLDNIIGVLLYKDLLNFYIHNEEGKSLKEVTISSLVKPVVYTPETKKISILLQELKAKQLHLAIVVDEYGGTEGIVTIEDILEELVGEIADEYDDLGQESLFASHPQAGWIVDGKMNIIDIEKELAISIPQSPEYDTLGGYIFHRAGTIPTKGWKIHHENFDLEILKSSDRAVEKVRILSIESEDL